MSSYLQKHSARAQASLCVLSFHTIYILVPKPFQELQALNHGILYCCFQSVGCNVLCKDFIIAKGKKYFISYIKSETLLILGVQEYVMGGGLPQEIEVNVCEL